MQEKIVITEQNIEEMCRLAEDVMQVLYMEYFFYDEEGNAGRDDCKYAY